MNTGIYRMPVNEYIPADIHPPGQPFQSDAELYAYISSMEEATGREFDLYKQGKYTSWLGDKYDYYLALHPESEAAGEAERMLAGIFGAANQKSSEINACFVVLIQPAEIDVADTGPLSSDDLWRYSSLKGHRYHPENLVGIAERAAARAGVDYINLYGEYKNAPLPVYESFTIDNGDNHWNATGVGIAAEALQHYILEKGCLGTGKAVH